MHDFWRGWIVLGLHHAMQIACNRPKLQHFTTTLIAAKQINICVHTHISNRFARIFVLQPTKFRMQSEIIMTHSAIGSFYWKSICCFATLWPSPMKFVVNHLFSAHFKLLHNGKNIFGDNWDNFHFPATHFRLYFVCKWANFSIVWFLHRGSNAFLVHIKWVQQTHTPTV